MLVNYMHMGYHSAPKSLTYHFMTNYDVFDFRLLLLEIVSRNKNLDHHEDLDLVTWMNDYILNFYSSKNSQLFMFSLALHLKCHDL
jgi:hypothetical protein